MKKPNKIIGRISAALIALLLIVTTIAPTLSVTAKAETQVIESFYTSLIYGAELQNGKYVWTANDSNAGHRIAFRINTALSGEGELAPGEIRITVPKHILRDRKGNLADICELSVPHESEAVDITDLVYYEKGDSFIITNHIELPAGYQGFIELAYDTSKRTFEYTDMGKSDDFTAAIDITRSDGATAHADADPIPVYINTNAQINYTNKNVMNSYHYTSWQSAWGTKPDDADEYNFLVWEIRTYFRNATQPYTFTLNDVPSSDDTKVMAYKLQGAAQYSQTNTENNCTSETYRTDYVITGHKKSTYDPLNSYSITNRITASVTPADGLDAATSAAAADTYTYLRPTFSEPIGHFNAWKFGSKYNGDGSYGVANYDLDDLKEKEVDYLDDNLHYYVEQVGYPYPWTLEPGASSDQWDKYGKRSVTYVITDEKFAFNGNEEQLTSDDYEIARLAYSHVMNDARFDETNLKFVSTTVSYTDSDIIYFEAKFSGGEWVNVGTFYLKTNRAEYDADYVESMTDSEIVFKPNCTGYRVTTTNAHYYTGLYATPYCKLKGSDYILEKTGDSKKVYLTNYANAQVLDSNDNVIFSKNLAASDFIVGVVKESYINKSVTSTVNNKFRRYSTIGWKVTMEESFLTNNGREYIEQSSGTYYALLPKGCDFDPETVAVSTENGFLSDNEYSVTTTQNYKRTGRTLLTVQIKEPANCYTLTFNTSYSWDSILDYGRTALNSVAYETGNKIIANGYPDNGGSISERNLLVDLDPTTNDKRFLYAEHSASIGAIIYASTGLSKKVKATTTTDYSNKSTVRQNTLYTYRYRYATLPDSKAKDLILYDSLENFAPDGKTSDWHGTLSDIDISQPKTLGASPVIYYSKIENLSIPDNQSLDAYIDGEKVWLTESEIGDISQAKAIAIDLMHKSDGSEFILEDNKSLAIVVFMQSPDKDETGVDTPMAYNNIYANSTTIRGDYQYTALIHQDHTSVTFRIMSDFGIYKTDTTDNTKPIKDISFLLDGVSDYGTGVYRILATDKHGHITFRNIEKGTYVLREYEGNIDYQQLKNDFEVKIDGKGDVYIDGEKLTEEYFTITDEPRIHTDIEFCKKDLIRKNRVIEGATFKLYGKSDYNNDIVKYATSGADGIVRFENIELGTYSMIETATDENHIVSDITYTVRVDDNANFAVSDSFMEKDGTLTVYNEPYHSFTIQKVAFSSDQISVRGAKFKLTGTSDYGTYYEDEQTSRVNGQLTFSKLEAGSYVLQETFAPEGYILDDTKRVVTVAKDGTITIQGIEQNDSGHFVISNKENGTVVVTKKWVDNETNETRTAEPVIHVNTSGTLSVAYFDGYGKNSSSGSYLNRVTSTSNIKAFKPYLEDTYPENAVRIDDQTTDYEIRAWLDSADGTLYWWSNAQKVCLTDKSNRLFYNLYNCETMDLSGINTSLMTDMNNMFYYCQKLTSLDVSSFDMSNVTNMSYMFYYCQNLTSLDLSGFDTSNVTNMSYMFYYCQNLTSLDLSGFDTSNVTNMSYMFYYCRKLTSLDLSSFDTSNVTDMSYMFATGAYYYPMSLTNLVINSFDTSNVTNMSNMFYGCQKLTSLDVSGFDTSNVTNMSYMFYYCSGLTTLDVSHFDTSNVTNMSYMFSYCRGLTTLDVSHFDTSNVTDMNNMFSYCRGLKTLDVSNFDTSNVTNMAYMFGGFIYEGLTLTTLDVSNFDTSKVTNMRGMFNWWSTLSTIDVSGFDTSKVTDMNDMFNECNSLKSIDVSNFDTSNVTDMTCMFSNCYSLKTLDVSNFDTSNVETMYSMFAGCSSLTTIDVSNFKTSKVTYMAMMFYNCYNLAELDLSSFDTSNVISVRGGSFGHTSYGAPNGGISQYSMLQSCYKLTTVYVSDLWNLDNVTDSEYLFSGCTKLVGGQGTTYDSNYTDKTYARIDDPDNGKPGYFTYKAAPTSGSTPAPSGAAVPTPSGSSEITEPTEPTGEPQEITEPTEPAMQTNTIGKCLAPAKTAAVTEKAAPAKSADPDTYEIHYKSDEPEHCIIEKISDDTWIYNFTGLNPDLTYYIWEEDLDGYISSNPYRNYLTVTDGKATITNTTTQDPPKYGSLSVNKTLSGELTDNDTTRKFIFTVTLTDENDDPITGTQIYGDTVFKDGVAIVNLAHAESITFTDIPEGYHYKVEETADDGFEMSFTNDTGVIVADETVTAEFTNTKTYTQADNTSFTLAKTVAGNFEHDDSEYTFNVELENLRSGEKYTLSNDQTFTADRTGAASVTVKLSNGESVTFNDIPVGTRYRVTETAGDYRSSYMITDANALGLINSDRSENSTTDTSLSTAFETADSGEEVTVTFTNYKFITQDLAVRKVVTNTTAANSDIFNFTIDFTELNAFEIVNTSFGRFKADGEGTLSIEFGLGGGDEAVFYSLPVGAHYKVTEAENDYYASYIIQDSNNLGMIANSADNNDIANKAHATEEEVVNQGENAVITFTNRKVERDIKVTKYVDMTWGDETNAEYGTQQYAFTVMLRGLDPTHKYTIEYTERNTTGSTEEVFYSDDDGNAELELYLRDGESFTIKGLPVGTTYTITEAAYDHFISAYSVICNDGAELNVSPQANTDPSQAITAQGEVHNNDLDVEFIFSNTFTATGYTLPDTGYPNMLPVEVSAAVLMVIFAVVYYVSKRRVAKAK